MNVHKESLGGSGSSKRSKLARASSYSIVEMSDEGEKGHAPPKSRGNRRGSSFFL